MVSILLGKLLHLTVEIKNFLDLYLLLQTFGYLYYESASHVFRIFPLNHKCHEIQADKKSAGKVLSKVLTCGSWLQIMSLSYLPGTASLLEELDKKLMVLLRDGRTLIGKMYFYSI